MSPSPPRIFKPDSVPPPHELAVFSLPASITSQTPVDLEIGCGVGWHPITYARQNPTRYLIALERTSLRYDLFVRRLARHAPIPNLLALHADAVNWVTHCLVKPQLSRVLFMYPNPEPKNPARRWIRMPFMTTLLEKTIEGGELRFATNIPSYADELIEWGVQQWKLKLRQNHAIGSEPGFKPRTHFEKKYLARGEPCRELIFTKEYR